MRAAQCSEFNLDQAEWVIVGKRMKKDEDYSVTLSRQAVKLLCQLHTYTGGRLHLFPNYRKPRECIQMPTMNRALERMGLNGEESGGFSPQGFRATASASLNGMGFQPDVIGWQLAHTKTGMRQEHAEYMEERESMMQQWTELIDGLDQCIDKVTPVRSKGA